AETNRNTGAGRRKLRNSGNGPFLASLFLHRFRRECRVGSCGLPPAILSALGAAVLSGRNGAAGGGGQLALLSFWRGAKNRSRRSARRICAFCPCKDHG